MADDRSGGPEPPPSLAVTEDSLGIDESASMAVMSFNLVFKTAARAIIKGTYQH